MKTDVDRNSAAPACYAVLRNFVMSKVTGCQKELQRVMKDMPSSTGYWRGQIEAYENMDAALDELESLTDADRYADVPEICFGNMADIVREVIRLCEPTGYVGSNGQFLKVLKAAIAKEEASMDVLQEINRHVGNGAPDVNRHVLPSKVRDAMDGLLTISRMTSETANVYDAARVAKEAMESI